MVGPIDREMGGVGRGQYATVRRRATDRWVEEGVDVWQQEDKRQEVGGGEEGGGMKWRRGRRWREEVRKKKKKN